MPSFELTKLQTVTGPRALSGSDRPQVEQRSAQRAVPEAPASDKGISIEIENAVNPSKPPVDQDRVAEIREALRDGSYPLVPAKIADAMIAAQLSFSIDQ